MGFGKCLGDGQPDPRATPGPVAGGVGAVEPLEKVGQVLGGDALPVVGDGEHHRLSIGGGADADVSVGGGVTQGVVEQIRREYHGWDDETEPRLQRVYRVLKRK